jgi:hypothetical protein
MAKAILELEMPESCWQCPCIQDRAETYSWCGAVGGDCPNPPYEKRRDDCPLKLVDVDALERKEPKKVVSMETTNKFKNPYGHHPAYGHCPVCGRIYWAKCHVGNYCDNCGQRLEVEP